MYVWEHKERPFCWVLKLIKVQNFRLSAQLSVYPFSIPHMPFPLFPLCPRCRRHFVNESQGEQSAFASCATYLRTKVKKPKAIKFSIVSLALSGNTLPLIHSLGRVYTQLNCSGTPQVVREELCLGKRAKKFPLSSHPYSIVSSLSFRCTSACNLRLSISAVFLSLFLVSRIVFQASFVVVGFKVFNWRWL